MKALQLTLILVSLLTFVLGQFLVKSALNGSGVAPGERRLSAGARRWLFFGGGIASMTVSFFLTLGLLQKLELSFLFPFQGLSVIIVTLGASVFLKERLTVPLVAGALLVTAGVMLVSSS